MPLLHPDNHSDHAAKRCSPAVAAIVPSGTESVDELLLQFVAMLKERGWRVRGLVQAPRQPGETKRDMAVIDINAPETRYRIGQAAGSDDRGCRLDPSGVAAASVVLRRALAEGADLVIANRFGMLESRGDGLASEMLAVMAESIPLLTVVPLRYLEAWRAFTGSAGVELAARMESLEAWVGGQSQQESPR